MAEKESYLRMLPSSIRQPLRKLFDSGAELNNRVNLSKAETTGMTMSGAMTTGLSISGACTTSISITGAFTTGINIAADGTTAIEVTSAFTGTTGISIAGTATDGIKISGNCTDAIEVSSTVTNALNVTGTCSGNGIDFSSCTYTPTGSNGPCLIRAGSYGTPLAMTSENQSGLIRLYMENTAAGSSYDRGIFVCLKTQNVKGIFPIAGLAEVKDCAETAGPKKVQAAQFICHLNDTGAKLAALGGDTTAGMYGGWFKITANSGATTASASRAAPLWVDNQLYGANINAGMEEYGIFMTTGGSVPKAAIGFETTSSGWANLLYFDETAYDQDPVSTVTPDTANNAADGSLKIDLNGTTYYIPYFGIGKD